MPKRGVRLRSGRRGTGAARNEILAMQEDQARQAGVPVERGKKRKGKGTRDAALVGK